MGEALHKGPLLEILENKDVDKELYCNAMSVVNQRGSDYATLYDGKNFFTSHSYSHLMAVEKYCDKLLGDSKKKLSPIELYLLICAIYMHDYGMGVYGKRKDHHLLSEKYVNDHREIFKDPNYAILIGLIIRSHGEDDLKSLINEAHQRMENIPEVEDVRIGALMGLLRMSDLLDCTKDRAPYEIRVNRGIKGASIIHWSEHSWIDKVTFDKKKKSIFLNAKPIGPYSSRKLDEKIKYINEQLEINKPHLSDINVPYEIVKWDEATQDKLKHIFEDSITSNDRNYLEPFVDFDKKSYSHLHGRSVDEDGLINTILSAKVDAKIPILVGDSKIGKTALVHGRIEQAFQEMDFDVEVCDYIGGSIKLISNKQNENNKTLLVIDQVERFYTSEVNDKAINNIKTVLEKNETDENFHVLFVVRGDYYKTFHNQLAELNYSDSIYLLRPMVELDVIKKLLNEGGYKYDDIFLEEIDKYLTLQGKNDITTLQIIVQSALKERNDFFVNFTANKDNYNNVSEMADYFINTFYKRYFKELSPTEKNLLMMACNTENNGTVRVVTQSYENEKHKLQERKIITLSEDGSYEFLHDSLVERFCEQVLSVEEKQLLDIRNRIIKEEVTSDTLQKIKKNREKLVQINHFSYRSISSLIYYYAMENNEEQVDFWIKKYPQADVVIETIKKFSSGIKDRIETSSLTTYIQIYKHCIEKCFNTLPDKERNETKDRIINIRDLGSYLDFCLASELESIIGSYPRTNTIKLNGSEEFHDGILIEQKYQNQFLEIYFLFCKYEVLKGLLDNNAVDEYWLIRAKKILLSENHLFYYKELYETKIELETQKYCYMASILLSLMNKVENNKELIIATGSVEIGDEIIHITQDEYNSLQIQSDMNIETLYKFAYKEKVAVAYYICEGVLKPIAYMKHMTHSSFTLFRKKDIENTIRKYKICVGQILSSSDRNTVSSYIEVDGKLKRWDKIISEIEKYDEKYFSPLDKLSHSYFPKYIPKQTILKKLFVSMLLITCSNLRRKDKFTRGEIVLRKLDKNISRFNLYDDVNIRLFKRNNSSPFEIDLNGTNGEVAEVADRIDFNLQSDVKHSNVISWEIEKEVEFNGNSSNAIIIAIGDKYKKILEKYRSAFSFTILLDDKINQVSKAVDEWEYEINKITRVIKLNPFITDIFMLGNLKNCKKATGYLLSSCESCNIDKYDDLHIDNLKAVSLSPYFLTDSIMIYKNKKLHIIESTNENVRKVLNDEINQLYIEQSSTLIYSVQEYIDKTKDDEQRIIQGYLNEHFASRDLSSIIADTLDNAYKITMCLLANDGERQIDSYNKKICELKGLAITIPNIHSSGFTMSYRRNEIDQYYEEQWLSEDGDIYKSIHANELLDVNQLEVIVSGVTDSILKKKGNRKLMFSFYRPTQASIVNFKMPSLLECFVFIRYEGEDIFLDSAFTWRTSECILGLPMSLESSIRWLSENLLKEVKERTYLNVCLGTYKYIGLNMHCFDNEIARGMITNIISSDISAQNGGED